MKDNTYQKEEEEEEDDDAIEIDITMNENEMRMKDGDEKWEGGRGERGSRYLRDGSRGIFKSISKRFQM